MSARRQALEMLVRDAGCAIDSGGGIACLFLASNGEPCPGWVKVGYEFAPCTGCFRVHDETEAALRQLVGLSAVVDPDDSAADARFPLLTPADLARLPEPSWLIDGMVPASALTILYGPSGHGKSFLALDLALCVEGGLAWYGQKTKRGLVVFVAAEGVAGLRRRVKAWETARNATAGDGIRFLPAAVNLLRPDERDKLRDTLAALPEPPALIVVDTMARTMVGGDENAARDVGQFIANIDAVACEFGAAVLVVHHTGKNGEDERGSSALRGAADAMFSLKPDGAALRLECTKAKDSEPAEPWTLHLETVAESCVLRPGTDPGRVSPAERKILDAVSASFGTEPTTATNIIDVSGVPRSSVFRALKRLDERNLLVKDGSRYRLTDEGQREVVPPSPNGSHETPDEVSSHGSPLGTVGLDTSNGWHEATPEEERELERLARKAFA